MGRSFRSKRPPRVRVWRVRRAIPHDVQKQSSTQPLFLQRAAPRSFSFRETTSWHYGDPVGYGRVTNPIVGHTRDSRHLILVDRKKPRAALAYWHKGGDWVITSIQRLRTEYVLSSKSGVRSFTWNARKETERGKDFARELGMHPSEFLLSQFLFAHRDEIISGKKIFLELVDYGFRGKDNSNFSNQEIYGPILERFFKRTPSKTVLLGENCLIKNYELSLEKRRVREALGLPLLKK